MSLQDFISLLKTKQTLILAVGIIVFLVVCNLFFGKDRKEDMNQRSSGVGFSPTHTGEAQKFEKVSREEFYKRTVYVPPEIPAPAPQASAVKKSTQPPKTSTQESQSSNPTATYPGGILVQ